MKSGLAFGSYNLLDALSLKLYKDRRLETLSTTAVSRKSLSHPPPCTTPELTQTSTEPPSDNSKHGGRMAGDAIEALRCCSVWPSS